MPLSARDFDRHRSYLLLLARTQLRADVSARVDASDVVQQTLVEAYADREQFRGRDAEKGTGTRASETGTVLAWLRRILAHNLANAARDHHREKRDVGLERSLEASIGASSVRLGQILAAGSESPSQDVAREEELVRLAQVLDELPEEQREAVVMRYLEDRPLAAIAEAVGCSKYLVTQRLRKALEQLRTRLGVAE